MRIFHVLNHSGRLNGHVHAAVDLACAQAASGHHVAFCSAGGDFDALLTAKGVAIFTVGLQRRAGSPAALFAMARLLWRWQPDVVHAHMVKSALLTWPGCRLMRIPLVTTVHNAFSRSSRLMGVGSRVIAVSDAVRRSMEKRGLPRSSLRTVLNGTIGAARFEGQDRTPEPLPSPSVIFVGGLHPRKGVGDLIAAFARVLERVPTAKLFIVGEGPHEDHYRAAAAGLGSSICFTGPQSNPQSFLLGADIFVLPSLSDPAPLVIAEAREAGCAIVATHVDGIPELLDHGRAGLLVPPQAPEQLAEKILLLLEDSKALALWRSNSQSNIDYLRIERVSSATVAVYQEVTALGDHKRWRSQSSSPKAQEFASTEPVRSRSRSFEKVE